MLNFKFVPPHQRVLAVNMCAIAWNAYLRYDRVHGHIFLLCSNCSAGIAVTVLQCDGLQPRLQ